MPRMARGWFGGFRARILVALCSLLFSASPAAAEYWWGTHLPGQPDIITADCYRAALGSYNSIHGLPALGRLLVPPLALLLGYFVLLWIGRGFCRSG